MKLVKFEDGTYGIRRYWFFGWFFNSLYNTNYVWRSGDRVDVFCKGTKELCETVMEKIKEDKEKEKALRNTKHKVVK